jgi:hypothetical protein
MRKYLPYIIALLFAVFGRTVAAAQPVAVIEDIQASSSQLEIMDFVTPGQVIDLGESGKVVLGYMKPCIQETITGGTVTIQKDRSEVRGGQLIREDVACAGSQQLSGQVAGKSGAMAFRSARVGLAEPDTVIMGTSPVFVFDNPASHLTITRMDRRGETYTLRVNARYLDTAKKQLHLHRGGIYKVKLSNDTFKTFKIDSKASDRPVAIISRMVRLP